MLSRKATISAYEKGLQWMKAMELLWELQRRQMSPDVITFSIIQCHHPCMREGPAVAPGLELVAGHAALLVGAERDQLQCGDERLRERQAA